MNASVVKKSSVAYFPWIRGSAQRWNLFCPYKRTKYIPVTLSISTIFYFSITIDIITNNDGSRSVKPASRVIIRLLILFVYFLLVIRSRRQDTITQTGLPCKGASTRSYTRSYTRLFYLVFLYVYDLLSLAHVQKYVYDVLQSCWIFCTLYTCTTYKCTSLLYSDELIIIAGVSNQMGFLQDIHYKLFYMLIFSIKHVKKAKLWSEEDYR